MEDRSEDRTNKNNSFENPLVTPSNMTVVNDEYSRFRTKSPLSSVTKTFLNSSEPVVSSNGFVDKGDEPMKVLEVLKTNGDVSKGIDRNPLESIPRRISEGNRSNDLSSTILNRYSYTESSKSPVMSKRSPRPVRYSYREPASSTSEPVWYHQEHQG